MVPVRDQRGASPPEGGTPTPALGLALGGGGILGLAHVGVLEVLTAAGLAPSVLTGTSVGALIAAFHAAGIDTQSMKDLASSFSWSRIRQHKILPTMAVYSSEPMSKFLAEVLPTRDFDSLRVPLGMVATDLRTSQMVVIGGRYLDRIDFADEDVVVLHADLADAIRASCTVPVLFEPVEIGGRMLVDGVLTNNVPAGLARKIGARVVVAVDLKQRRAMYECPSNIFEYIMQSQTIYRYWAVKNRHIWADVVIRPELREFGWDDTSRAKDIISAGREAAAERLPDILAAVRAAADAAPAAAPAQAAPRVREGIL